MLPGVKIAVDSALKVYVGSTFTQRGIPSLGFHLLPMLINIPLIHP